MIRIDRLFAEVCMLTLLVVVAGPVRPVDAADRTDPVGDQALYKAGLSRYWTAEVPIPREDSLLAVHLVDDTFYLYTEAGIVFALQADTGLIRWGQQLSGRDFAILRPGHIADTPGLNLAAFLTTNQSYVIDRYSGEILSTFTSDFAIGSPPVGVGDTLFMGSADGNFYALVWHTVAANDTIKWWTVRAGGPVTAAPLLFKGDRLIVVSQGGQVFSFFARDKALIWSQKTGGAILGNPVLDADDVIVASTDRSVYKFNGDDGTLLWRHRADSPLADGPAVVDHTVYQYSSRQGLLALDADTGREKWRAPDTKSFVAQVEGRIAVWNGIDTIMLLDRDTGKVLAKIPVAGGSKVVTNVHNDAIYVVGSRGRVVCVRPRGVPYLHPSKVAKGRASLNRSPESRSTDDVLDGTSEETTDKSIDPFRSRRDVSQKPQ